MESLKLVKGIQITLITILLIVIAIITVGKLSNSEITASDVVADSQNDETSENIKTMETITVRGDANGDGEADFKDLVKINRIRLDKTNLEDEDLLGADVTGDGKVDFKDIVKINRFRLNKITEL